jgi:hypothetical protein
MYIISEPGPSLPQTETTKIPILCFGTFFSYHGSPAGWSDVLNCDDENTMSHRQKHIAVLRQASDVETTFVQGVLNQ